MTTLPDSPTLPLEKESMHSPEERIWQPVFELGSGDTDGPIPSDTLRAITKNKFGVSPNSINLLRDNYTLTTWLLVGACLQGAAFSLFPTRHALLAPVVILLWRVGKVLLQLAGILPNPNMNGVILGKFSRHQPDADGQLQGEPAQESLVVLLLGTRSNHPLGLFNAGFKEIGELFNDMVVELEKEPEKYHFHGSTQWIGNGGDRATSQEILTIFYFNDYDGLHKFAHSPVHRKGWDWWNTNLKSLDHISIMHEMYEVRADSHESIFENIHRSGRTGNNVKTKSGKWVPPLVDASQGQYRTSLGRTNRVDHGRSNDRYNPPQYKKAQLFCPAMSR